jgi:dehydrogenase/reductase SDR family protein 7B
MGIIASSSSPNEEDHYRILQPSTLAKSEYKNKSILITGASRGLGRSLALTLSTCNPSLLILSGRDEAALKTVQEECYVLLFQSSRGGGAVERKIMKVEIVVCDLANRASVEQLAETSLNLARDHHLSSDNTNSSGTIDILINNGGISSRSSFLETSIDVDERVMQVNFFAGVTLAKKLVPSMIDVEGMSSTSSTGEKTTTTKKKRIIWISSIQGKLGTPYRSSYAASKFAIQGYCESLRSELSSSNVDVHIVSPGYIRTNLSQSAVMGDGRSYSKTDETTANGADPDKVAVDILNAVAAGNTDFVVAATLSAKIAIWIRFLLPSVLNRILVKRFEKQRLGLLKEKDE